MELKEVPLFIGKVAILLFCIGIYGACMPKDGRSSSTLRVHFTSEPSTLHPIIASNAGAHYLFDLLHVQLLRIDPRSGEMVPLLLTELPQVNKDGLSYEYTLRKDIKWDDGKPFTAMDVAFTLKLTKSPLMENAGRKSAFLNVKEIELNPSDPFKFKLILKEMYFANPGILQELYFVPHHQWDSAGVLDKLTLSACDAQKFDTVKYPGIVDFFKKMNDATLGTSKDAIVGLGGYVISSWQKGSSITLKKKSDWWGARDTQLFLRAYPQEISFAFGADDAATYLGLVNGELDVVTAIGAPWYRKLVMSRDILERYDTALRQQFSYNLILINTKSKTSTGLGDLNVRRALTYLTPVDELNQTLAANTGVRQASFIQPVYRDYYNDDLRLYPYLVDSAQSILTRAGYKDGDGDGIIDIISSGQSQSLSYRFTYIPNPTSTQTALIIQDAYRKAGILLIPTPVDNSIYGAKLGNKDFDLLLIAFSGNSRPDDPEQLFHTRNWVDGGMNFSGFGNAHIDSLIEASNRSTDPKIRATLLKQLQKEVYDYCPIIYTYSARRKVLVSKRWESAGAFSERPGVVLGAMKPRL